MRDIKKVISLIKGLALLNLWFRERDGGFIRANDDDIKTGFELWNKISESMDHGLSPYVYGIYTKVIVPLWTEKSPEWAGFANDDDRRVSISRKEILNRHMKVYGRPLNQIYLRQHILPQLEASGLIMQEKNPNNLREMLVVPLDAEDGVSGDMVSGDVG